MKSMVHGHSDSQLTPRERQILRYLAEGCPAKEIADRLAISRLTVNKHLQHIYRKLHAKNRIHAVLLSAVNRNADGSV